MAIEITTALIAFIGVLIGLGASYLLLVLQRRWNFDDQKREWRRKELEKYSEMYKGVTRSCLKLGDDDKYSEGISELHQYVVDIGINPPSIIDSELNDLFNQIMSELENIYALRGEGTEKIGEFRKISLDVFDLVIKFQKRINILIEGTYK